MNKLLLPSSVALATVAFLTACGDEITEVTNTGMSSVAAYEDLAKCGDKNEGELVFVKDSGAVYLCSGKKWSDINGNDGKNGKNGTNGTSCTVEALDDGLGYDVLCGGKVVGQLLNGEKGDKGEDGNDGKSCTVKENKKKNGYDLVCGDKTVTITNGDDGESVIGPQGESCTGKQLDNGNIQITCGTDFKGVLTKGVDGENCTVKENVKKNGYDLDCGGEVVTISNGTPGAAGKSAFELAQEKDASITDVDEWLESLKGKGCTAKTVEDGVEITCGDSEPVKVNNGKNGSDDACKITDDKDGVVTFECGGDNGVTKKLYKATCNTKPYDPETHFCYYKSDKWQIIPLCGDDGDYDPTRYECVEGHLRETLCEDEEYNPEVEFCAKKGNKVLGLFKKTTITVKKGYDFSYSKTWMAENLNFVTTNDVGFCYGSTVKEKDENCAKYGRQFMWPSAVAGGADDNGNIQGVCPDGWHLPSIYEWRALIKAVNTSKGELNNAGKFLKATTGWNAYDGISNEDIYGFSALPGTPAFGSNNMGELCIFLSATGNIDSGFYGIELDYNRDFASEMFFNYANVAYSVRCVQD